MAFTLYLDGQASFVGTIANGTYAATIIAVPQGLHSWYVKATELANVTSFEYTTRDLDGDGLATLKDDGFYNVSASSVDISPKTGMRPAIRNFNTGTHTSTVDYFLDIAGEYDTIYYVGNVAQYSGDDSDTVGMKLDRNNDNDVKDADDDEVYNAIYIYDGNAGTIALAHIINGDITNGNMDVLEGSFQRLRGYNYTIAKIKGSQVQMGPSVKRFVPTVSNSDNDVTFFGDARMALTNLTFVEPPGQAPVTIQSGTLYIKKGAAIESVVPLTFEGVGLTTTNTEITQLVQRESDVFDGYHIFLNGGSNPTTGTTTGGGRGLEISIINTDQIVLFQDDSRDVFGYSQVQVNDGEFMNGCNVKDCDPNLNGKGRIVFLSDKITLQEDAATALPGLIYRANFSKQKVLNLLVVDAQGANFPGTTSNTGTSETRFFWVNAADTTPPQVTLISPTLPNSSSTEEGWAYINVTSNEALSTSWVELWNASQRTNTSMSGSGTSWYLNITNLNAGVYNFRVWARDTAGNLGKSEERKFNRLLVIRGATANFTANGTKAVVNESTVVIEASPIRNTTVNVTVSVSTETIGSMQEMNNASSAGKAAQAVKYMTAENSTSLQNLSNITIKLYFSDGELGTLDKNSLALYYWNGSMWVNTLDYVNRTIPNGPRVFDAGRTDTFVYAVVDHLSSWGIGGSPPAIPSPPTIPSSGSGSSGGIGAGYTNSIQISDVHLPDSISPGSTIKMVVDISSNLAESDALLKLLNLPAGWKALAVRIGPLTPGGNQREIPIEVPADASGRYDLIVEASAGSLRPAQKNVSLLVKASGPQKPEKVAGDALKQETAQPTLQEQPAEEKPKGENLTEVPQPVQSSKQSSISLYRPLLGVVIFFLVIVFAHFLLRHIEHNLIRR